MASRRRFRTGETLTGAFEWLDQGPQVVEVKVPDDRCDDVIGNYGKPNPLDMVSYKRLGGTLNGAPGVNKISFLNTPVSNGVVKPSLGIPSIPHERETVNRILSQTGPLTPKLYLPLSIFEMRDIPAMLKHAGDLLHGIRTYGTGIGTRLKPAQQLASSTLAYQFGWGPLMQDIGRMIDFSKAVRDRQYLLRKAHTSKGIRRKITLEELESNHVGRNLLWSTHGLNLNVSYRDMASVKRWATIRWKIRDQTQYGKEASFIEAFNIAYGLNRGYIPIMAWKALPWSWAADWFVDLSNALQARHNMLYYEPSELCTMTHSVMKRTILPQVVYVKGVDRVEYSGSVYTQDYKKRTVNASPNPSIRLRLPFLDNFKLSILGSMSILGLSKNGSRGRIKGIVS